mgnify:CR=1 FL=1
MQFVKSFRFALVSTLLFTAHLVTADAKQIQLPPETAKLPESDLAGYKLATQKCTNCHSVDYIQFQAPGMNQAQWTSEVAKMKHSYGAELSAAEIKSIGAYLAVVYGTAKATDSEVLVVSVVDMSAAEKAEAELDVQVLLDTNGCLGCHALDAKLLGPSFKAIAVKYKSDVQAQAMLARSIQQGGVGKWGQIPMPPIAGLSDKQAEALAAFIMAP